MMQHLEGSSRMHMPFEIYQPTYRLPLGKGVAMVWAALVYGVIIGIVAFLVSRLVYLVVLFPIGIGLLIGFIVNQLMRRWKVVHPPLLMFCALVAGLLAYATLQFGDYLAFREELRGFVIQELGGDDFEITSQVIDMLLIEETGSAGFWGYLQLMAREGISIGSVGDSSGISIKGFWVWLYWAVELGVILFVAVILVRGEATAPFCVMCQSWYRFEHMGSVVGQQADEFLQLLRGYHFKQAGKLVSLENTAGPHLAIYRGDCGCPEGIGLVRVNAVTEKEGKLQFQDILTGRLSHHAEDELFAEVTE